MEELLELRTCIEQHRYDDALALVAEMEEMSKDDKINKIGSYIKVVLIHLIKRYAEQRNPRLWELSIDNAVYAIRTTNQRRKARGYYVSAEEIQQIIQEIYPYALRHAALDAFEGRYEADELAAMVNADALQNEAFGLLVKQEAVVL